MTKDKRWERLSPPGKHLMLRRDEKKEDKIGSIIIPDTAQNEQPASSGKILKVGRLVPEEYGFKPGKRVYIPQYAGSEIMLYTKDKTELADQLTVIHYKEVLLVED